jgi:hypothetical protein
VTERADLYPHGLWVGQEWEGTETGERARLEVIDTGLEQVEISYSSGRWQRLPLEEFVATYRLLDGRSDQ